MLINGTDYGNNWIWPDELDWSPVAQATEYTLTGALVLEEFARQAGRPITLVGEWLSRAQLDALIALRDATGTVQITYRGLARTVAWRHGEAPITARQIFDTTDPADLPLYEVTLKFIEA